MDCGIYKIENLINGKCYIGQSIHVKYRDNIHFSQLRNNKGHNQHLQNSYNKYGKDVFRFTILLFCEEFELTRYEKLLDKHYKKLNLSYNIRECADSNKGQVRSREERIRLSIYHSGKHLSDETKRILRDINIGKRRKHSEETKRKISEAHKGISHAQSEATKKKISKSLKQHFLNRTNMS